MLPSRTHVRGPVQGGEEEAPGLVGCGRPGVMLTRRRKTSSQSSSPLCISKSRSAGLQASAATLRDAPPRV